MLSREKRDFITSFTWIFGCTKKAAEAAYRDAKKAANTSYIQNVIACFKGNSARCFYED